VNDEKHELVEVGVARTPFKERRDAPFQPGGTRPDGGVPEVTGRIEIHPEYRDALRDLEGFERVWLLYVFHLNQGWKNLVTPPRGPRQKRGIFATRSPHRPSRLGMTCARLLGIEDGVLLVSEIDILDGTPIVDIKPYLPYADSFPDARYGWVEEVEAAKDER
jgi:tRNA-Thr(GGU) m(6)t(6)A37 methyltransferase TsaA